MKKGLLFSIGTATLSLFGMLLMNKISTENNKTSINASHVYESSFTAVNPNCPPSVPDPYLGGLIYLDYDWNGDNDINIDQPVAGVTVNAYNDNGGVVGTSISDNDGSFVISNGAIAPGQKYRLEFSNYPSNLTPSFAGVNNNSSIQIATANTCTNDFALVDKNEYCQNNPPIVTSCYAEGNQASGTDVLISFAYDNPVGVAHEALSNQIGSTFGIAYQKHSGTLFAASYMKRFAGVDLISIILI